MAKVETRGPMLPSSNRLQFAAGTGDGGSPETTAVIKIKTPSELILKRKRNMDNEDGSLLPEFDSVQASKNNLSKNPIYVETRIDDLFRSSKNILFGKRNVTENVDGLKESSVSISTKETRITQSCSTISKSSVTELSLGGEKAHTESFEGNTNLESEKFCSEFHVPVLKIPLDLTLKTSMRVVTSSSVNWFHRLTSCGTLNPSKQTLYTWVYPPCSYPTSVITALTSSAKEEGEMDLLSKRQLAWETSFRNLYIMLRKNITDIFYVCTGQFVAMFTSANAYLSQSTTTLRSLLKEQDICFTMPLCYSKGDNSPESLLAFSGKNNVHGLYDLLLNYRFLLTSLSSFDVPLLYSPVPFENAALSAPEIKYNKIGRVDNLPSASEPNYGSDSTSCYSIEINDTYLPPWIVKSVCDALASNGSDFEASFVTEPMSIGLNVALGMVLQRSKDKAASDEGLPEKHSSFDFTNTGFSPRLSHAFLKSLRYSDCSCTASFSPI